jgi:hypothetical protein
MVDRPDRLDPIRKIGEEKMPGGPTPGQAPGQSFESYMEKAKGKPEAQGQTVSPFDLAKARTPLMQGPTFDSLIAQAKSAHTMLGDINTDLQTKNLKLKPSERHLLRSKLQNANGYLKAANVDLGVKPPPPPPSSKGGVIGKLLDLITEGQNNLSASQGELADLSKKGEMTNPIAYLGIQLKMAQAQQEIEYASIMLSNAVSAFKTLFNVQL